MVEDGERLRLFLERTGQLDLARRQEEIVAAMRERGMPQRISDIPGELSQSEQEQYKDFQARLADTIREAIRQQQEAGNTNVSFRDIAGELGAVAEGLPDSFPIRLLMMPNANAEYMPGVQYLSDISMHVRGSYNRVWNTLLKNGMETIGQIRQIDEQSLLNLSNVGKLDSSVAKSMTQSK